MTLSPLRVGDPITFRDQEGREHAAIFIGGNPKFTRVKMVDQEEEFIVSADSVQVRRTA